MRPCPCSRSALVRLCAGALGVSCVMTQLALMRELLDAFCGNELVLGAILGNWLLLTGLGAWGGRIAERLRRPLPALVVAQILVALVPLAQVLLLRGLRNVVFLRGAAVGATEAVVGSFVLLLPFCLGSGFLLTLACTVLAGERGRGEASVSSDSNENRPASGPAETQVLGAQASAIGAIYVADSLGSILGGALFSFVLVRWFDHVALLFFPAFLNLVAAAWLILHWGGANGDAVAGRDDAGVGARRLAGVERIMLAAVMAAVGGLAGLWLWADLDGLSTAWQYPRQRVVFRGNSPYGRLVVTESGGQFNFFENGVATLSSHHLERAEETVHYAMAQRPANQRVLLVSGGLSGTAQEVLKYPVQEVVYVELDPLLLDVGKRFLPGALADPRIRVVNTDGRLFLKQTLQRFDVVIVDTPDPATSQLNRFFTVEFFAEVKRVLRPAGVLSFPLGRYENFVGPQLARLLACAHRTARQAFANVRLLPGGRVFFLASDGPLFDDVAGRLEAAGIRNRQVKRPYLEAMLAPDRMADMGRAITVPAGLNEDLAPVLYYYHLIHWLSQFQIRFGLLGASLLALFLFYLFRLRPAPLAVFASGFAASALEVVLLLGFQALHGSLYQQLGIVVTLFMAGLAAGAWLANRCGTGFGGASPGPSTAARTLACLAFALALLALLLPLLLHGLGRLSASPATAGLVPWVVPVLAFILALLVGAEFPLANQLEFRTAASTAARLYTADFLGASLGALLAGTLLIPLLGAPATCWLTAALNLVAALALRRRV